MPAKFDGTDAVILIGALCLLGSPVFAIWSVASGFLSFFVGAIFLVIGCVNAAEK